MARSGNRRGKALATAGLAVASAFALGLSPAMAAIPSTYYVRGTNIGGVPPEDVHRAWVDGTVAVAVGAHGAPVKVQYPGGFWPVSHGYLGDPTYGDSVDLGVRNLGNAIIAGGDADNPVIIHGYSQGAVVATDYLREHPGEGNIYVLAANPNRPNGGILQRFSGLYIPILGVSFSGATPTDDEIVVDIARQYDGWADFPKYPLNLLATANALLGIVYLHGKYPEDVTPEVLADLEPSTHGNTTYYLVPTKRLPLLMPLQGILPESALDTLDAPLRAIIETGYDRVDYGVPTPAAVVPTSRAATAAQFSEPEPAEDAEPADKRRRPDFRDGKEADETSDTTTDSDDQPDVDNQTTEIGESAVGGEPDVETSGSSTDTGPDDKDDAPAESPSEADQGSPAA
ncbi:PE-PPE domain-containing protein [Mycobacterium sp. MS1601]|uniref:PE-PPE domain-containing protein n=1 Tax=Mycobacterium sp. MS1601 TaxID=1936029 RepID=UPI0012F8C950|nr:PE-PPE domain-containing protein [Mycobacterium sp. MS1601]